MVTFTTTILKFDKQGEKTGWTYIEITEAQAHKLSPNNRKSFRVKGKLDGHSIKSVALLPMGNGYFIMPLNAALRKAIGKRKGAQLKVQLELDAEPVKISPLLLECLEDEPKAKSFFATLKKSEQNYYSKWIDSAKTDETKAKRVAQSINGFLKGQGFPQMLRALKAERALKG